MRKWLFIPLLVLLTTQGFSQAALTRTTSNLRDSASTTSRSLARIPKGTEIYIESSSDGWCKTIYQGNTGYVSSALVVYEAGDTGSSTTSNNAHGTIKYYTNVDGQRVQSPTVYDQPPAGATAQCNDGTYSFSQNHRGTCSRHGGVKKWLQ
jgi:uncharacterized protein YgiM (DUF1202 family)